MLTALYYALKPLIPRSLQLALRRAWMSRKRKKYAHVWPIDEEAARKPEAWTGWPEGKRFALVLTHDVETKEGQSKCRELAELEMKVGFRSSFNFVAEEYPVDADLLKWLADNSFEVGIHGLNHRGNPFASPKKFVANAHRINHYLKVWGAVGFRAPSMYHNLDLIHHLDVMYDSSTFDTDPMEPQPDGVRTIFPFFVTNGSRDKGYVELPYTLPQDSTLFLILCEKDCSIWKTKLDWIAGIGGMALLATHPDYVKFGNGPCPNHLYPEGHYREFLQYVKEHYEDQYWPVLPKDVARYWTKTHVDIR